MAKSKNKSNSSPRRKRYNRNARLQNAKKWAEQYNGKNIAKGYSNWFGVDLLCAVTELEILGYKFKQSYKEHVKQSLVAMQKQKERKRYEKEQEQNYEAENFYFIAGYTSNGVPFGITTEKIEIESVDIARKWINHDKKPFFMDDEDLPF
ncbi:hypothetical protein J2Y03_004291 [Neobacillus niacini]|uniref:hypothetical protein n=1 Tax=Neobacillus niacini TaxID=86668 RepID=UPI002860FF74|nr:hypothetical protein [Neobacillus niacini]MDR7079233.1 hypothetical protein [Neobacillus niacini]